MRRTRIGGALFGGLLMLTASTAVPATTAGASEEPRCERGPDWELSTTEYDNAYTRHAFVGNGYLSQRVPPAGTGYVATGEETGFPLETPRFDGAFMAGVYSVAPTAQTPVPRHAIAAIPTWSTLSVTVGEHTYSPQTPPEQISNYRQSLNVHCGILRTSLTWTPENGKATDLVYEIIADRNNPHVGAVRVEITPHWDGQLSVTDALDGAGARRMQPNGGGADQRTVHVGFRTDGVGATGTVASTLEPGAEVDVESRQHRVDGLTAEQTVGFSVERGETYELAKFVGADTTPAAVEHSKEAAERGWEDLFAAHARSWQRLWASDVRVPGRLDLQQALRSTRYAVLSSIREGQWFSIPPAGLSSDNYAGLIFWDAELWIYPSLLLWHPELAKPVVDYREKTLPAARRNASSTGQQGAFYPWTSADTGDLQNDCHSWDPPHCLTQNHLQSDIAFAAWQYYLATGDRQWLAEHGWPVLSGIAEYWAGRVTANPDGSYSINDVAGPDEYSNGVDDGVFTNAGAATALRIATRAAELIGEQAPAEWATIADRLRIPFDEQEQVFLQYDGYDGHLIKQADTVLLQYPLEWPMSDEVAANTLAYYAPRTDPDGPAMTDAVHAIDAAEIGEPGCATNTYLNRSILPFLVEPFAQFSEARGERAGQDAGAPALNFLTGGGGFQQVFTHGLTGLRLREDGVELDPVLPPQLSEGVELTGLHWQGRSFDIEIGPESTALHLRDGEPLTVHAPDGDHLVSESAPLTLKTRRPDLAPTDNVARCQPATATSEEPGMYAEAAVDGSTATIWTLDEQSGSLTVDLGEPQRVSRITPVFNDVAPVSHRVLVSEDGENFTEVPQELPEPRTARYVRVELTGPADAEQRTGLRELEVR
ncbi:discoidin domain-containing protein [Saccharopolyspora rectivirgula]|jgi:trehalose/maltose hydrolase-like predicted phosphorylase|uniref:Haloacid dehalogenase n=1 Tax=Saccharopolyspora rectivirgula TaxID=28042 RepID=A0A073AY46_9PSEU|nr:discoidin domain-containing protein [Saccharopolyspora rectivirgula]KEI44325.1 haloacid dehalogenase [Saccharopolyspora rectivirgula]